VGTAEGKPVEEMSKTYDPQAVEPGIIDKWLEKDAYARRPGVGDCTVVIPPPNVTGMLHMGHALDDTIQDTIVRHARMQGKSTRWILGTDHAGIATQTRVDKKLKSEGISRLEIGREKFVDACWDWTREYGGIIVNQIKRMGCSVDFSDPKFTMDPDYARAVRKVFCDWYHDGLIYRGNRIVNWCPNCTTAISDDEAEYRDEASHLWYLRYPLTEPVDGVEYVVVATTRPETMLGDTGVAVSPKDPEKAKFIGKTVRLPIVGREIPIFSDYHVDANFGTGFVKVTPAHDPNDYAMGQTHDLPQINIFDEHAVVVDGYGEFSGMDRDEARKAVVAWFEEHGLLDHIEDITHSVMHCYRCDSALEPWLSEQWFVAVDRLKGPATEAVASGRVTFHPDRWTQTYTTWMENLKDWCISRQLWWGHRIPVFYCDDCGWEDACMEDVDVCPKCGGRHVHQDENVLDTWFSSQLWTFATQGWPDHPEQMQGHHPTTCLVTARDIIALWVARMVMSSEYFIGEEPFHDVVIYPTVLAKDGSRMSKSKGNGVDPMKLIDEYGADAMRFGLLMFVTSNQDVKFDEDKIKNCKGFVTKIWNASRFVLTNLDGYTPGEPKAVTDADKWIFSRLAKLCAEVDRDLDEYLFGDLARTLYAFFWNEFCDWYIECCKGALRTEPGEELSPQAAEARLQTQRNLVFVLDTALRLLHPAMPFVTEHIWEKLPLTPEQRATSAGDTNNDLLMLAAWPDAAKLSAMIDDEAEHSFDLLCAIVGRARSVRARFAISPRQPLALTVSASARDAQSIEGLRGQIIEMGALSSLSVGVGLPKPAGSVSSLDESLKIYVELAGLVDFDKELARVNKQLSKAKSDLASVEKVLANPGFLAKATPEVIADKHQKKAALEESIELMNVEIADFS
jgi:valyl-tRNA synthetase